MFYNATCDFKTVRFAICMVMSVSLFNGLTFLAYKELSKMTCMIMVTGNERVEGFNTVD